MDRRAWGGQGEPGAGLEQLLYLMLDHQARVDRDEGPAPASIAFFLAELSNRSREWRSVARSRRRPRC